MQAVEAKGMGSDSDSEVSDGDDATNEQLQQQYAQGGGMLEGGGAAAASARTGSLSFNTALLFLGHGLGKSCDLEHQGLKWTRRDLSPLCPREGAS